MWWYSSLWSSVCRVIKNIYQFAVLPYQTLNAKLTYYLLISYRHTTVFTWAFNIEKVNGLVCKELLKRIASAIVSLSILPCNIEKGLVNMLLIEKRCYLNFKTFIDRRMFITDRKTCTYVLVGNDFTEWPVCKCHFDE